MTAMLEVTGLRSGYNRIPILHGIDMRVETNQFVGILGHNGMGKTTLLKTIIGLVPATGGKVVFEGRDITRLPVHARSRLGIGYVPQGRQIFPELSVAENLRMGAVAHGGADDGTVVERSVATFPLLGRLVDRRGGDLSGGEQQVLSVARCLAGNPRLVLFDEPTEGIQPSIVDAIAESLQKLHAERGLTILLVEQNLDFISALAQRLLILQRGVIVRELPPEAARNAEMIGEFTGMSA